MYKKVLSMQWKGIKTEAQSTLPAVKEFQKVIPNIIIAAIKIKGWAS